MASVLYPVPRLIRNGVKARVELRNWVQITRKKRLEISMMIKSSANRGSRVRSLLAWDGISLRVSLTLVVFRTPEQQESWVKRRSETGSTLVDWIWMMVSNLESCGLFWFLVCLRIDQCSMCQFQRFGGSRWEVGAWKKNQEKQSNGNMEHGRGVDGAVFNWALKWHTEWKGSK